MTEAEARYHEIADQLADCTKGKMFGSLCLKAPNGKALAIFKNDCMIFKLTGEPAHEALGYEGAAVFSPMKNRPMNGWIEIPYEHETHWERFAQEAMDYVRTLKGKK